MIRLSSSLLAKLSTYPETIRDRLAQPLTPATIRDGLRILHGEHSPSQALIVEWLEREEPADTFLARLIRSPRFAERAEDMLRGLKAPPPGARHRDAATRRRVAELAREMIVPMASVDAPYVYKLDELAQSNRTPEPGRTSPDQARAIRDLVLIQRLFHDNVEQKQASAHPPGTALARQVLAFARTGSREDARLLSALLAAFQCDTGFRRDRQEAHADLASETSKAFAIRIAGYGAGGQLSRADRETLRMLEGSSARRIALLDPVPLAVVLDDVPPPGIEDFWKSRREMGLIQALRIARGADAARKTAAAVGPDAGVTILPADFEISDLLAVAFRCAVPLIDPDRGASARPLHVPDPGASLSWESEILGYPERRKRQSMGVFIPACARGQETTDPAPPLPVELRPAGASRPGARDIATRNIDPECAYAIVLKLETSAKANAYLNIDNCLHLDGDGLSGLRTLAGWIERGKFGPAVLRKPLVLIGADTPPDPQHVVRAVARHWAYGGRYATTGTPLDYDAITGRFHIAPGTAPDRPGLARLTLAPVTTLPLEAVPSLVKSGTFDWLHRNLLSFADQDVAVCVPDDDWSGAVSQRLRLARKLDLDHRPQECGPEAGGGADGPDETAADEDTDGLRDLAARRIRVTRSQAAALSGARHWPIESLAAERDWMHLRAETAMTRFLHDPSVERATAILAMLERPEIELRTLRAPLDGLICALTEDPALLSALPEPDIHAVLRLARLCPSIDAIAARLAVTASTVVGDRADLVLPLIDVLATGLPPFQLREAWVALAATAPLSLRMGRRLTHSGRRHAGVYALGRLAVRMAQTEPGLLDDPRILQNLVDLPGTPGLGIVARITGRDTGAAITAVADTRSLFRAALEAGDREAMYRVLSDAERLGKMDLDSWLNDLRVYSNEFRDLDLSVGAYVPPGGGVQLRKLMAAIFQDRRELATLADGGFLNDGSDLSAVCLNCLGRNDALDAVLARAYGDNGIPSPRMSGDSVAAIFANAAASVEKSASSRARSGRIRAFLTRRAAPSVLGRASRRVSVAMSAHDPDPRLLAMSLASLRAQSHRNIEIFVVDDASGPAGRAAIDAEVARDPDIRLIRHETNVGPYLGRNKVIEAMSGDVLAIQDADDWSHPDRFAAQLAAFADHPYRQLVTTRHIRIDAAGRVQLEANFAIAGDGPMTSMFRRRIFDDVGAFAAVRSRGDIEMRERLRAYYGTHALHELRPPMVLSYASAGTLSQRVRLYRREALQLWRAHIDDRPSLSGLRGEGTPFDPAEAIVPWPLRPTTSDLPAGPEGRT